jgi:hypothetical protein
MQICLWLCCRLFNVFFFFELFWLLQLHVVLCAGLCRNGGGFKDPFVSYPKSRSVKIQINLTESSVTEPAVRTAVAWFNMHIALN